MIRDTIIVGVIPRAGFYAVLFATATVIGTFIISVVVRVVICTVAVTVEDIRF